MAGNHAQTVLMAAILTLTTSSQVSTCAVGALPCRVRNKHKWDVVFCP